jgi:hypothetical protein
MTPWLVAAGSVAAVAASAVVLAELFVARGVRVPELLWGGAAMTPWFVAAGSVAAVVASALVLAELFVVRGVRVPELLWAVPR